MYRYISAEELTESIIRQLGEIVYNKQGLLHEVKAIRIN